MRHVWNVMGDGMTCARMGWYATPSESLCRLHAPQRHRDDLVMIMVRVRVRVRVRVAVTGS